MYKISFNEREKMYLFRLEVVNEVEIEKLILNPNMEYSFDQFRQTFVKERSSKNNTSLTGLQQAIYLLKSRDFGKKG